MAHILHCYLFVVVLDLEMLGLGYAMVATFTVMFVSSWCFTRLQADLQGALVTFDGRAFRDLSSYLKIAFPSYLMLALTWWTWELMVLISGLLGVKEQAATVIIMNLIGFLYSLAMGFDIATCALVGQQIGNENLEKAKLFFKSSLLTSASFFLTQAVLFYSFKS